MSYHIFLTGFPGFITSRLISRLCDFRTDLIFHLLVQEKFLSLAEEHKKEIVRLKPELSDKIKFYIGDITMQDCGLHIHDLEMMNETIQEVWHLAAVYDLAIDRDRALNINVYGTQNVLGLIRKFKKLERHYYISTAYVSGNRTGVIYEEELSCGQQFRNFYEESKYLAEVEVKKTMGHIPTTIFRPGIVVGDSKTGETQKLDGPYYVINLMDKLPNTFIMTLIGSGQNTVNFVPVDFLISAMSYLSSRTESKGKVYHLTDPKPLKQIELVNLFSKLLGKHLMIFPIPYFLAKTVLGLQFVYQFTDMPKEVCDYFDHPHRFDCTNTLTDLKGSEIKVPNFSSYAQKLVDYFHQIKNQFKSRKAMF